jgi:predicted RNA-binding protein (virulence factor B family)
MLEIGKAHKLKVIKTNGDLLTLDAEEHGLLEVINNDLVLKYKEGDVIDIFLYNDNDRKLIGTIGKAYADVGEFAKLKVVSNTKIGSFLDWGIEKDLLCPFSEQKQELVVNHFYTFYVYLDELTDRAVATMKFEKFILDEAPELEEMQNVEVIILNKSQLGYNAVVENKYAGLFYDNEVFTELKPGQKLNAIVKKIRDDNKIDLRLFKNDYSDISNFEKMLLEYLEDNNGIMKITDESDPELIYKTFGISKKNFKKALGALYKKELVNLETYHVELKK